MGNDTLQGPAGGTHWLPFSAAHNISMASRRLAPNIGFGSGARGRSVQLFWAPKELGFDLTPVTSPWQSHHDCLERNLKPFQGLGKQAEPHVSWLLIVRPELDVLAEKGCTENGQRRLAWRRQAELAALFSSPQHFIRMLEAGTKCQLWIWGQREAQGAFGSVPLSPTHPRASALARFCTPPWAGWRI